jgi:hypothetical protein
MTVASVLKTYVLMICGVVHSGTEKLQRAFSFYYESLVQQFRLKGPLINALLEDLWTLV